MCTSANIPLHKSDNPLMREFLQLRVVNGGPIPKCSQLHDYYLFDVYQTERANLKEIITNKKVALIVDKLNDNEDHYVLDVMAVLLDFDELSSNGNSVAYLLDMHFFILGWEVFEKGFGKKPIKDLLKGIVPCNPENSKHLFLLVVLPKEKELLVLDSK